MKQQYVLNKVKQYLDHKFLSSTDVSAEVLIHLIDQWQFDYEMDQLNNPENVRVEPDYEYQNLKAWEQINE
ncbi:hypothetical protein [Halobacillus litoralis]|uniref:hypothetical protein n=1 Tax=Halobacillus litoralis TaxID=45668 RepID=UPI001CD7432E|nr:hypothetical protein [Halobacillus litoralis]MCA1021566.1 hypothetical protein [Halobacillus litoralis]